MDLNLFFGRFHPLIVHLPIGFMILAVLAELVGHYFKKSWNSAIAFMWLSGSLSAIVAIILGLLLASDGSYQGDDLFWHKWMGITTGVLSLLCWLAKKATLIPNKAYLPLMVSAVIALTITGHKGGNLTHGATYLTDYAPAFVKAMAGEKATDDQHSLPADFDSILVFDDLVMPVLEGKCVACHNENKQNGNLLLTSSEGILKGGDHGAAIMAGQPDKSLLFQRVTLNFDDPKYMPPKGSPLSYHEIQILEWWIATGASFDQALGDADHKESVAQALLSQYQLDLHEKPFVEQGTALQLIPEETAQQLQQQGFSLTLLHQESKLYEVIWRGDKAELSMEELQGLLPVKENITWLDLSGVSSLDEGAMKIVGQFSNLTRLRLQNSNVSDALLSHLTQLPNLASLNLFGTGVSDEAIEFLIPIKSLKKIYLMGTLISQSGVEQLKSELKGLAAISQWTFTAVKEEG